MNRAASIFLPIAGSMGKGATIAALLGNQSDCMRFVYPLLWSHRKAIQSGLFSKPVEFDGIKQWIVNRFPYS